LLIYNQAFVAVIGIAIVSISIMGIAIISIAIIGIAITTSTATIAGIYIPVPSPSHTTTNQCSPDVVAEGSVS
jgi:hypothetical protein